MGLTHPFAPLHGAADVEVGGRAAEQEDRPEAAYALAQEREEAVAWVREQVAAAVPVPGTLGERYLLEHRRLRGPWPRSLLYAANYRSHPDARPRACLLAVVTDPAGVVVALQAVELDPRTGAKSARTNRPRRSRGPVSEGTVYLGDPSETSAVLVIGEGVESTLTRCLLGPCDAHACLGALRTVEPRLHHRRVEILADTDARDKARPLARAYAAKGIAAFVVTVPDSFGPKADLNDLLVERGPTAVQMAVEDAERIERAPGRSDRADYDLSIGSDVEIAHRAIERVEDVYGNVVVDEGRLWRFDRTHWSPIPEDQLVRLVHKADGTVYVDIEGRPKVVKLSKSRVASILDAMIQYRREEGFFASAPVGINCASGFIRFGGNGAPELVSHARRWRQRHVVRGRYPAAATDEQRMNSRLAGYVRETFAGDDDADQKRALVGELAGCAALGWGTRTRNPKAVVAFSEEGGTGKSTLLAILRELPNPEAVASVPPGKFGDEKYAFRLIGKVLNAADELPDRAIRSDVFKRVITGEPVPARDLYKSATDFRPVALHLFSSNTLPSFAGGVDGGVVRRLLPVEFRRQVPEDRRDPDLVRSIVSEEADLLLELAVEGAGRLIERRDLTIPKSSRDLLTRWTLSADPVRAWAAARLEVTAYESLLAVATLYHDFVSWSEGEGFKAEFLPNNVSFGKRLRSVCPALEYQRSDGSRYRNARIRPAGAQP